MCWSPPPFSGKAPKCFFEGTASLGPVMKRFGVRPPDFSRPNCMAKEQCQPLCFAVYKAGRTTDVMVVGKPVSLKHSTLSTKIATIVEKKTSLPIYQLNYGGPFRNSMPIPFCWQKRVTEISFLIELHTNFVMLYKDGIF